MLWVSPELELATVNETDRTTNRKPGKRRQQWNYWSSPRRQRTTITAVSQGSDRQHRRTVQTDDDDACQRRRTTSANNNDVQQRWSKTTVSTTGHRDVATLEALTYQASRQLSTSWTTVDIHFRFDKLLIIFIFQQLVDKMLPIRDENTHQTLFSNNKFDRIRLAQTTNSLTIRRDVYTLTSREEEDDVSQGGLEVPPPTPGSTLRGARPIQLIYVLA